jgi:DNA processing protein
MLVLARGAAGYPRRLLDLKDAPLRLFASGPLPERDRWLAIVGARKCSEGGRMLAELLAKHAAENGVGVVSGGAIGIDASAHRGALAGGGATIAVLPTPIRRPSPKRNWRLFGDIKTNGGALISEIEHAPLGKGSFRDRNRIIAALADFVLVVEAGPISGTRYTVRAARQMNRPLGAVPWDDGRGAVASHILARGGRPIRSIDDLCGWLSLPRRRRDESDPVLAELGDETIAIDHLAKRMTLPIQRLLAHLTRLELEGRLQVLAGSRVRRS